jgi:hypothetical protein
MKGHRISRHRVCHVAVRARGVLRAALGACTDLDLSGTVLLVPRTFVFQRTCQCADVPLGFFMSVA